MSRKLTAGCYSKLASAKETTGVKIAKTTSYSEAITALSNQFEAKKRVFSALNFQTLSWIINKE